MQGDKAPSLGALLVKLGCLSVLEADEALVHLVATVNTAHTGSCGKALQGALLLSGLRWTIWVGKVQIRMNDFKSFMFELRQRLLLIEGASHLSGSREVAFIYAISSAGVVYTLARACSQGDLDSCSCDPTKKGSSRDAKGSFSWGGCSDHVEHAMRFSQAFVDAKERKERDARALMNLHNNRAGRKVGSQNRVPLLMFKNAHTHTHTLIRLTSCLLSFPGGEALHDAGVQVSRCQRLMQHSHLLVGHGRLQTHWRSPPKEVQRRRGGGRQPVRHRLHHGAHALQAAWKERPGVLRGLSRLLHTRPRVRWVRSLKLVWLVWKGRKVGLLGCEIWRHVLNRFITIRR